MTSASYRFGVFRLDPASRRLWRGDDELELPRRVFDCIVYLIEHRERAVEHDELFAAVWGDVQLSDRVIAQAILEARRALGDTDQERQFIKTLRGFGYHWVAPVEVSDAPVETGTGGRRIRPWMVAALLAGIALTGAAIFSRHDGVSHETAATVSAAGEGAIALLLPVTIEADDRFAWARLGVMDLIARRLQAAGQPMVPSDSVIALLGGSSSEPGAAELDAVSAATGSDLLLRGRAASVRERWRVSLRTVRGMRPPLTAIAEADDVLDAARTAADRMALSLGLSPPEEPTAEPELATLLHRMEAAMMAQQHDTARELLEAAGADLRRQPAVRLQMARIDLHDHRLEAARRALESLRTKPAVRRDPALQARVLLTLGWVHKYRADLEAAEPILRQATDLLTRVDAPTVLARVRSTLGAVALDRGAFDAAREHFAHARVALEGTGDAPRLANLENHLGVLEALRDRYAEALPHFERAADRHASMHDVGNELGERANILYMHLGLLDTRAAAAVEPRVEELLARTTNPLLTTWAQLSRAYLLFAGGQSRAAEELLSRVLQSTEGVDGLNRLRLQALALHAETAARDGDARRANRLATAILEQVPPGYARMAEERGRAGWIAVRARIALGRRDAAEDALEVLTEWAERGPAPAPRIYAALAAAELAAADGRAGDARSAYERALALADAGQVPLRTLRVAESYVPWLLAGGPGGRPDSERALVVAGRVAEYADRHHGAALLQLRVTHAVGSTAAWRTALDRARSLAGERQIPEELRTPPRDAPLPVRG